MIHELLQLRITEVFGLTRRSTWPSQLADALLEMTQRYGLSEPDLVFRMAEDAELLRELASYLTIDESHFLRHADQFPPILEAIEARLRRQDEARVWSVGCARGEEPYSLAILLREQLGGMASRIHIVATDINPRSLVLARRGSFRDWSFRGVPPWFTERYFRREDDGAYRLAGSVVDAVKFELAAIHERLPLAPPRSTDVVLFRNVAIYFESRALRRVYEQLGTILRPGGLLVTAPADPPPPRELFGRSPIAGVHERRADGRPAEATPVSEASAVTVPMGASSRQIVPRPALASSAPGTRASIARTARPSSTKTLAQLGLRDPAMDTGASSRGDSAPSRNAFEEQLRAAAKLITARPTSSSGYLRRGRLYLSVLRADDAIRDFRSALFLDGGDLVTRFWYATALQRAGKAGQARSQVKRLAKDLQRTAADALLGDGETTAAELLDAVRFMRGSLT